jgi:membrane-bound ClpP family serine protease
VSLVTFVVVALLVTGILLVVLEANSGNQIVKGLLDAAKFLAGPFENAFKLHGHKANIAVNWGLAAVVYAFVGGLIARLLRR